MSTVGIAPLHRGREHGANLLTDREEAGKHCVVMDIGGTTVRTARYFVDQRSASSPSGLGSVRRVATAGIAQRPMASASELRSRVLEQIIAEIRRAVDKTDTVAIGIAFAGPVTAAGVVLAAPTIWGAGDTEVPLVEILRNEFNVPVLTVNDLSAAVWRYVEPLNDQPFCLITVSSGIGNKVYRDGHVLIDADGHGGEIGHWCCDTRPTAPLCDCGRRGHLGAIASGRGVLAAARCAAAQRPAEYSRSMLSRVCPDPAQLGSEELVAAIREGDELVTEVLLGGLRHLASAINSIYAAIGVRRFRIIGGFAIAIGERYTELLTQCLQETGCFSLTAQQVDDMVQLGHADDYDGLIGVGRLLGGLAQVGGTARWA